MSSTKVSNDCITSLEGSKLTGNVSAAMLTGTLPALDATNLTSVSDTTKLPTAGGIMTGDITVQGVTEVQVTKSNSFTPSFSEGTIYSCTGSMTITMPTPTAGKSFTIIHATATSITWSGTIKWSGGSAPTADAGIDIYVFVSDGSNWYGVQSGTAFA